MSDNIRIGIAGVGFVGDAIAHTFGNSPHNENIDLILYDKFKNGGIGNIKSLLDTDFIYFALPTLFNKETNNYDLSAINEVCEFLSQNQYKNPILIKSTVQPGCTEELAHRWKLNMIHNPEFLTARTAREDFANQSHIVLGYTKIVSFQQMDDITNFYKLHFNNAEISTCKSTESESMKIFVNSFYAIKVQAFNEFYALAKKQGSDFNIITKMMLKNGWINPMHTTVPGPDGKLSYGGACFPKDTQALLATMEAYNTPCEVLKATVKERNSMRDD
tara:strand:+ start:18503 stop:19327 length:825 start_codon:yes stop_codon:yes gene_type:complete